MAETSQLVSSIISGIEEKKGHHIVTVNMECIPTAPCEWFVICTAGSPAQADAITDAVELSSARVAGEKPAAIAGRQNKEWVAMDYGTVMVHIFLEEARLHYDLEHLWNDAAIEEIASE